MSEQTTRVVQGLDLKLSTAFSVGLAVGLIIGVLGTIAFHRTSPQPADAPPVTAAAASVPKRWFIWEGSAPLYGEPFGTETECEKGRKQYVGEMANALQEQAKQVSQLSIRQAVALGVTPQDLEEKANRLASAYCRAED